MQNNNWEQMALGYLARYNISSTRLAQYLRKKQAPEEVISFIVGKFQEKGWLNDQRYAENKAENLALKGKSQRHIAQVLKAKGVNDPEIGQALENLPSDLEAARHLVKRRKLGPYRPEDERADNLKKDMGILLRAGFSFGIARQALDADLMGTDDDYCL